MSGNWNCDARQLRQHPVFGRCVCRVLWRSPIHAIRYPSRMNGCAAEERPSSIAWVTDLVAAPERRRQGAASALLKALEAWALGRGVRRLILEMQSKNQPCIRLAQKFGYEFCGYNDQYYPTQDVALFFGRALQSTA